MKRLLPLFLLYFTMFVAPSIAQEKLPAIWSELSPTQLPESDQRYIFPEQYRSFQADLGQLGDLLTTAPMERTIVAEKTQTLIPLPMPDGSIEYFDVVESPIMEGELAEKFPEINTYAAVSVNDPKKYARIDLTPKGFHAMILVQGQSTIYIDPYRLGDDVEYYLSYYQKDYLPTGEQGFLCKNSDAAVPQIKGHQHQHSTAAQKIPFGNCELRNFRLAVAATGQYTNFHGGVAGALAAQVTTINRVNGILERDLAVRLNIVANNNLIIFTNSGTDPYSGGFPTMIDQNQTELDATIGTANYDIGHLFHRSNPGGGLAAVGVVCNAGNKARAVSARNNPVGDPFDVQIVAHEFGHQFNARHAFNNSCSGNRTDVTANEPGSGTTIMSYAGVCAPNIQAISDDYYNGLSLEYMHAFLNSGFSSCANITALANNSPSVATPTDTAYIPANTPFALTAIGSDPDGNALTYCWEGLDTVPSTMPPLATSVDGPMFRSLAPSNSATRYFPNLADLAAGGPFTWEVLPSVSRALHFRVTVRDNVAGGGCAAFDDMVVMVDGTTGPFMVTYPSATGINWTGATTETVTWDVAGTNTGNVACATVDILLSTDGGLTFPTILATNVPNDGSHPISVPNINSSTARIMVQCHEGTFFDISDNNFNITTTSFDYTITVTPNPQTICSPNDAVYTIDIGSIGGYTDPVNLSVSGVPAGATANLAANNITPVGNTNLTISNIAALTPGVYNMTLTALSTSNTKTISIQMQVNAAAPVAVTLQSPLNGATGVNNPVSFDWSTAQGTNVSYDIDIATDASFSNIVDNASGLTSNAYTSTALNPGNQYFWRVTASNSCGLGATSATADFTIGVNACDTISNYDVVNDNPALYSSGDGYIAGHNQYGDIAKADYFDYNGLNTHITGTYIGFGFAFASNASNTFDVKVWDGTGGIPGAELISVPITYQAVSNLIAGGGNVAFISFGAVPLPASKEVFVGIEFTYGNDTIALITNTIGQTTPATAWEQWGDNSWHAYDAATSWGVGLAHFIQPVLGTKPTADFTPINPSVCVGTTINFTNNSSDALSYDWTFANGTPATSTAFSPSVSFSPVGTYNISLIATNSCISDTLTTTVTATELTLNSSATNISCNAANDGSATATVTGGAAPISYLWSDGSTTSSINGLSAGVYTVTVNDAGGCNASASVTITEPNALNVNTNTTDVSCHAGSNGSITTTTNGGTAPYTYNWSNGATTANLSNLSAGAYQLTVTDANLCTVTTSANIIAPTALVSSIGSIIDASCHAASDASVDLNISGGSPGYTYLWSNGSTTQDLNAITAGTYYVTITDVNNCTQIDSATVTQPTAIVPTLSTTNITCNGDADGTATINTTTGGAGAPYTYLWSNGNTTTNLSALDVGIYSVTVTDAISCTGIATLTITEPTPLLVTISSSAPATCNGASDGALTAAASGGTSAYTYLWSNGTNTATATGLSAGNYTLTATDANACTVTLSGLVIEPSAITISMGSTAETCVGADGTASASPSNGVAPYAYLWSNGGNTATLNTLIAGTYGVTVTDANGCTASNTVVVANACAACNLAAAIMLDNNPLCNGQATGQATASGSLGTAPYTYNWSTGANTATATGLSAGVYTVTVSDAVFCTDVASITLTNPAPIAAPVSTTDESCAGNDGTATVTASGGTAPYTYLWSDGQSTATATGLSAGNYSVTTADVNGCTVTANLSIILSCNPCTFTATATTNQNVSCHAAADASITASGSGGLAPYQYLWSNGASSATVNGLSGGVYTVTITEVGGCTATATTTVTEPTEIIINTSISNISCHNAADGNISTTVSGGQGPYQYLWSNGSTNSNLANLSAGTYSLTVSDAAACQSVFDTLMNNPAPLAISFGTVDESCTGNDGSTIASILGGTTPYNLIWSTGATSGGIANLSAGTYSLTVTDANNCTQVAAAVIANTCNPCAVNVTTNLITPPSCQNSMDAQATATASGGTAPINYVWSNGETTATATQLGGGTYGLTVVDANGCTDTTNLVVTAPSALSLNMSSNDEGCAGSDGSASVVVSGATAPYSYLWSNNASTASISNLTQGLYQITVTDANACTASSFVVVASSNTLYLNTAVSQNVSCFGGNNAVAQAIATGVPNPSYLWSNGATTSIASGLSAGTYFVTATSGVCVGVDSVSITEPVTMSLSLATNFTNCVANSGTLSTTVSGGGGGPYIYLWSNGSTSPNQSNLATGTYSVTVTSTNGCATVSSASLNIPLPPSLTNTTANPLCNTSSDGSIDLMVSPAGNYQFLWSNTDTSEDLTGLMAATYSVTVTDTSSGCVSTDAISLQAPTPVLIAFSTTAPSSATATNGAVGANGNGGTPPYSYSWNTGGTSNELLGVGAGTYVVTVTDANGCEAVDSVELSALTTIAPNLEELSLFEVYPNPNAGTFNVQIQLSSEQEVRLQMTDVLGRVLYEESLEGKEWEILMHWEHLSSGTYFIRLLSNRQQETRKLILAK